MPKEEETEEETAAKDAKSDDDLMKEAIRDAQITRLKALRESIWLVCVCIDIYMHSYMYIFVCIHT